MGRITVFSLEDCHHCQRTKAALKKRNIPFLEISLTKFPDKRKDMLSLANRLSVPQVFLNETHIGGANETIKVLTTWDEDSDLTPFQYYESFVAKSPDPQDIRLQPSAQLPVLAEKRVPPRQPKTIAVPVPSGTAAASSNSNNNNDPTNTTTNTTMMMSVLEMMELLKSILPCKDLKYNLKTYKNCFRASQAVTVLQKQFNLTRQEGVVFGRQLQLQYFLDHVVKEHEFADTDNLFFRLQCYQTPNILNSYRVWTERVDANSMALLDRLNKSLNKIIAAHTDQSSGRINYKEAAMHKDAPVFEEAVCELQCVQYVRMPYDTKLAFSINLYNFMIKYAFLKVGIGTSDAARYSFFNSVSFQIGADVFSFQDLENGVLRGNRKAPFSLSPQFGSKEKRMGLIMPKVDSRIHFALNCGASSCPPIKNFTSDAIEQELRVAAEAFCEDEDNVRVGNDHLYLSAIFNWYQEDFGGSATEMANGVTSFLRGRKKTLLENLLLKGPVKVKFNKYDWSANASGFIPFSGGSVKANASRFI